MKKIIASALAMILLLSVIVVKPYQNEGPGFGTNETKSEEYTV